MKQTYVAPTIISNGKVVRETLGIGGSRGEAFAEQVLTAGSAGYYL